MGLHNAPKGALVDRADHLGIRRIEPLIAQSPLQRWWHASHPVNAHLGASLLEPKRQLRSKRGLHSHPASMAERRAEHRARSLEDRVAARHIGGHDLPHDIRAIGVAVEELTCATMKGLGVTLTEIPDLIWTSRVGVIGWVGPFHLRTLTNVIAKADPHGRLGPLWRAVLVRIVPTTYGQKRDR